MERYIHRKAMDETTELTLRREVAHACRILERAGQGDMIWGHVSVRDPEGRGVWLKGAHLGFDEVTEDDVILLSWDGEILTGSARRHLEYPIHTELMARRDDVNAVVHTHPLHSIAFAATGWVLKTLSHEGRHFTPPDIPRYSQTSEIVSTREMGQDLADTLGEALGVLMPWHGITTVGADIGIAVAAAVHLERACQIALLAGPDAIPAPTKETARRRDEPGNRHLAGAWEYLSRTTS
jgi:L-fuculose-phosphate aldolase